MEVTLDVMTRARQALRRPAHCLGCDIMHTSTEGPRTRGRRESVRILAGCALIVLVWRVALEIVNQTSPRFLEIPAGSSFGRWSTWDGAFYSSIVEDGYSVSEDPNAGSNVAFFPAFPIATRVLATMIRIEPLYVGLALNFILTIGITYFIFQITCQMARDNLSGPLERAAPYVSVALFLLYPSSLFLAAFYAEACLIFGITGAIYFAMRGNVWLGASFAAVASASKSLGVIAAMLVIMIHYLQHARVPIDVELIRRSIIKYSALGLLGISGLLGYAGYLFVAFGDPLLFSSVQSTWGRNPSPEFVTTLWNVYYSHTFDPSYFGGIFPPPHSPLLPLYTDGYPIMLVALFAPVVAIALSIYSAYKYRFYWIMFMTAFIILVPASTGVMESMNRYTYSLTPLFAITAIELLRRGYSRVLLIVGLAILASTLVYATAGFVSARFVG